MTCLHCGNAPTKCTCQDAIKRAHECSIAILEMASEHLGWQRVLEIVTDAMDPYVGRS